ncbi:hypothetical protein HY469_03490 [Candidatus Roizmanbacteria bacterium]|nr:hypothetical protein [Candidatus Roizmanbacteria bacterium]
MDDVESGKPTFVSSQTVAEVFTEIEQSQSPDAQPRTDILDIIHQFKTWEPRTLSAETLQSYQSYCDFQPGSITTRLTKAGREGTIGEIAHNFATMNNQLSPEFVSYITELKEHIKTLVAEGKPLPPILLLGTPEVFNGNMLDGVHRSLAYRLAYEESGQSFDPGLPAYVGTSPTNKLRAMARRIKQTAQKQWRMKRKSRDAGI